MARRGADRSPPTGALPLRLIADSPGMDLPGASESVLAAAFAAAPACLAVLNADGQLLQINVAGQTMLPAASPGKALTDAVTPEGRLALATAIAQAVSGKPAQLDCQASNNGLVLEFTIINFAHPFGPHLLVSARPVDAERRLLQRAQLAERHETQAYLASGLAHDFNNILTVIIGNAELLQERLTADPDSRTLAEISLAAARAATDLTRLLMSSTRPQPASEFCAADFVLELRGLLERSLGPAIALKIEADPQPWHVSADRTQFASVLLNLALNARDAMPQGGRLAVSVRNLAEAQAQLNRDCVSIAVTDTGSGMPAAILDRVFEPFFTTKSHGTGLGLPMVHEFAQRAGGKVVVESTSGAGTTVHLHLPRAAMQLALPQFASEGIEPRAREQETVLVAEQDSDIRALLANQLRALGYEVATIVAKQSFADALDGMQRLDLVVAGMEWFDKRLMRQLGKRQPPPRLLWISDQALQARSPGALLLKPFTRAQLARRVRATLDGRL
jgi:signal transduction histidine kinase/CheY-like chemotaxis protein